MRRGCLFARGCTIVRTGEEEPIAGILIGDFNNTGLPKPDRRLLIFGKGPSLAAFGVSGTLQDPRLDLLTTGQSNDNWGDLGLLTEELVTAGLGPNSNAESELWPLLGQGAYTLKLSGSNQSTGIGLLEIYEY